VAIPTERRERVLSRMYDIHTTAGSWLMQVRTQSRMPGWFPPPRPHPDPLTVHANVVLVTLAC
jgi:hypothetical protein